MARKVGSEARTRYAVPVGAMARQVEERKDQKIRRKVRNYGGKGEGWGVLLHDPWEVGNEALSIDRGHRC